MNSEQMKQLGIKEVFLPIDGFHNYEVSNYGNIRNVKSGKILKLRKDSHGYHYITLYYIDDNNEHKSANKQLHRIVLNAFEDNAENKSCVDHIDNNPLNNCLVNLRFATRQENQFNMKLSKANKSGIKGVYWRKDRNKWCAETTINGKFHKLGHFDNIEDAKQARQNKAHELFGEYVNKCEV